MKTRLIGLFAAILLISIGTLAKSSIETYSLTLAGTKEPQVVLADKANGITFELAVTKYSLDINFNNNTKSIFSVDWEKSSFTDFDGKSYGLYLSIEPIKDITEKFDENEPSVMIPAGWKRFYSIIPKNHFKDGIFPTMVPLLPKDAGEHLGKTVTLKLCCGLGKRIKYYTFDFVIQKSMLQ